MALRSPWKRRRCGGAALLACGSAGTGLSFSQMPEAFQLGEEKTLPTSGTLATRYTVSGPKQEFERN